MRESVVVYFIGSAILIGVGVYELQTGRRERMRLAAVAEDYGRRLASLESAASSDAPRSLPALLAENAGGTREPERPPALHQEAVAPPAPSESAATSVAERGRPAPTPEQMRDSLDVRFYGESADAQWRGVAERAARNRFTPMLPEGSSLVSLECRSSLCRLETSHQDMEKYREFTGASMHQLGWEGQSLITLLRNNDNGSVVSVAFLGRPGTELAVEEDSPQ